MVSTPPLFQGSFLNPQGKYWWKKGQVALGGQAGWVSFLRKKEKWECLVEKAANNDISFTFWNICNSVNRSLYVLFQALTKKLQPKMWKQKSPIKALQCDLFLLSKVYAKVTTLLMPNAYNLLCKSVILPAFYQKSGVLHSLFWATSKFFNHGKNIQLESYPLNKC